MMSHVDALKARWMIGGTTATGRRGTQQGGGWWSGRQVWGLTARIVQNLLIRLGLAVAEDTN